MPDIHGATYSVRGPANASESGPELVIFDKTHTDTYFLTDALMNFIDQHEGPGWCTHLSLRAPHPPWVAAAPYNHRYPLDNLPTPQRQADIEAEQATHPQLTQHLASSRNRSHTDPARHKMLQASYYGLMSEVDDNMGRLVNWLKDTGQWHNTLLIFTSDHGEQMGDHWMYGKAGQFDQSYHIPLIVHLPGGTPGVCDAFTEHVDILPTLLDALQKPAPRQCDGFSLLPWLTGDLPASDALRHWRTSAHFEFDFRHSQAESALGLDMENACLNVIRDQHYKYVHFADLPCLLFDLQQDRFELHNIAADAPAIVARYAQQLLSWRLRTTDKTLSHLQIKPGVGLADMSR